MRRIYRNTTAGIKHFDMFGYTIALNFNRKGESHKTVLGGIISLLVHFIIFIYIYIHLKKMFLKEDNKNYTEASVVNLQEEGEVLIKDTHTLTYSVIRHQLYGQMFLDDEDVDRSIQVTFIHRAVNWYKPEGAGLYTDTILPARRCVSSDFGPGKTDNDVYESWVGFTILCPDVPEGVDVTLMGDLSSMRSNRLLFQIRQCDNSTREGKKPCYSPEKMWEYARGVQVDIWSHQESIDYNIYDARPVYKVTDLQAQVILSPNVISNYIFQLRKHKVETQDSFFQIGSSLSFEGVFYQIGKVDERPYIPEKYPGLLFQSQVILQALQITHQRQIYNLLDLLADLGGVYEILLLFLGVFVMPISRHSFILKAIKRLYRGRTKDPSLFAISRKLQVPTAYDETDHRVNKERQKNRKIKVRLFDSIWLYLSRTCCRLCCHSKIWRNKDKFQKLFKIGERRITKELDVSKIIKNLKDIKICLRHSIMTDAIKREIAHTNKKIIDLDDTGQESSEVNEDTLDQDLQPGTFTSLNTIVNTQQALNYSSGGDDEIFTSGAVQRNIRKSMIKIKSQKARRKSLMFEQLDQRGAKFGEAIRRAAFLGQNKRLKLTQPQASTIIARWWRRMLMKKFRLGKILDPILEYRISQALNTVTNGKGDLKMDLHGRAASLDLTHDPQLEMAELTKRSKKSQFYNEVASTPQLKKQKTGKKKKLDFRPQ